MKKLIFISVLLFIFVVAFATCKRPSDDTNTPLEPTTDESITQEAVPDVENYNIKVAQIGKEQKLKLSWENKNILSSVEVIVTHGNSVVSKAAVEGDGLSGGSVELDVYYGKHNVNIVIIDKDGNEVQTTKEVTVSTDEYIIAPISGSMPQLYFTLYMNEITRGYTIPAFVWLTRPGSWNWNKLPENVFPMPTVDMSEVVKHNNYNKMVEVTDAYIEELFSINPDAKFHLYINDYNTYLYPKLMAGNDIPEENYDVVLLSDGGSSYIEFQNAFNSSDANFDADARYAEMAQDVRTVLQEVREAGDYNLAQKFTVDTTKIRSYCYVIAKEMKNVEWWMLRPRADTLICPDTEFVDNILKYEVLKSVDGDYTQTENNIIVERSFNTPLTNMNDKEKEALKTFYSFNDEMFAQAKKQGKKAMMFLGSWASDTNEPDFYSYVNFMKKYYGDEFVYYYKGHPSTPTSNYPHKQKQLKELELIDVESSINAELILFFYPDIYMCGYNSSTFMSAQKDEMSGAIFNMTKEECKNDYAHRIGLFVSKIPPESYISYEECVNEAHSYFLVEFNNVESNYQYAIYDATANEIINGPAK